MIKHPGHLHPFRFRICCCQCPIHIRRYLTEIFGFPTWWIYLVKRIYAINMISSEQTSLLLKKMFLNGSKQRFFGIQKITTIRISKTCPLTKMLNISLRINSFQSCRYMTGKSRQYRFHIQFAFPRKYLFL